MSDIRSLMPKGKMDVEQAQAVVSLGYPAVAPVLREIMVWMQDTNWPVTDVFLPFLTTVGLPLVPLIREVLRSNDSPWISNVLMCLVKDSPAIFDDVQAEVRQLASGPALDEDEEAIQEAAQEVLNYYRLAG